MKKQSYLKVFVLLLFTVTPLLGQENTQLKGTVSAPFLEEASIHIINTTQKTGTVNSDSGSFQILVRENDELLFSSIQYKNITVVITSEIIKSGFLEVALTEDVNVLAEVNISNIALTGNINTDISNMQVLDDLPLNYGLSDIKHMNFEADINDPLEAPRNRAFESNEIMGLALGGASISIDGMFNRKERKFLAFVSLSKASNEELKQLFQEDFFIDILKVEKQFIDDFIFYAIDQGLNELIKQSNKIAVTEFLIRQSRNYNLQLSKN
ncbi:hypothetical protein [Gillisia hiemivivida]|uniref:Carboxypeptidase-like regulatory domain-containing protein n=1 Tax=Gillisia hiemivivida TaxID=291190 RepID=A0A5C6ZRS0_9FLAO|nr:hypothetical protein [Gillisia hiemivivida]TXD93360.1 hypothetical protein ES724_10150 [Gillisia hiemivivida]